MLKKNDMVTLEVTDMNNSGYGISHADGMAVFIDGGITGETLSVKIIKVARDYAVGRRMEVITPSPYRIGSDCPVSGRCGGCSFRHITREYELSLKRSFVVSAFRKNRIEATVCPVVTDGRTDGYRNKVQYPVAEDGSYGYYSRHSHDIVKCDACRLSDPDFDPITAYTAAYARNAGWKLKHIYLRKGQGTGEIMLCLISAKPRLPGEESFVREVTGRFPAIVSVILNCNPGETNVILGKSNRVLYGEDVIHDVLCGCTFAISSLSFYQVNRGCAGLLYGETIRLAAEGAPKKVADLYCGAGTIGISLAKAHPDIAVTGVEIIPDAVENARRNAAANGIHNASFLCADAMTADLSGFDCVIVDPPRKGMARELTERLAASGIPKIVYVSCEPMTLARDAAILLAAGYRMGSVTPFDMFPRTGAVESVVLLTRENTVHRMKLDPEPFEMIKSGRKTIELRLFDEKRQRIKAGDSIVFTETVTGEELTVRVGKLHRSDSFDELYRSLPLLQCGYTEETVSGAKPSDMEKYYSAEEQKKYGVVGIGISRPDGDTDGSVTGFYPEKD